MIITSLEMHYFINNVTKKAVKFVEFWFGFL